ncbi:MAG: hypothetical protein WCR24_07290 [Candidatus Methanomethylophilaceae archaeon]
MFKQKTMAAMALIITFSMLSCAFCGVIAQDDDNSDAMVYFNFNGLRFGYYSPGFALHDYEVYFGPALNDTEDTKTPVGDTEALRAIDRSDEAILVATGLSNLQSLLSAKTTTSAATIKYISTFAQRQAEISVYELWNTTDDYDVDAVLANSVVYDRVTVETYAASYYMSKTWEPYNTIVSSWNSGGDYTATYGGGNMSLAFYWTGGSVSTYTYSPTVEYGMATTVTSESADTVYIRADDGGFIYVSGGSAVLTATDGSGDTYSLAEGKNVLSSMTTPIPTGIYELQTGRSYIGTLFPVVSNEKADVTSGAVIVTGPTTAGLTYVSYNGTNVNILTGGSASADTGLTFAVLHDGAYSAETDAVNMVPALKSLSDVLSSCVWVCTSAADAGQVQWSIFDAAGEASIYLSPSSIVASLDNYSLSTDERAMLYIAAMEQISQYYQRNVTELADVSLNASTNALGLFCTGTITDNNGQVLATNVVFTPMCYLRDQSLVIGVNNWDQAGVVAVWGDASTYVAGDKSMSSILSLNIGYKLTITGMTLNGSTVTGFDMNVIPIPGLEDVTITPVVPITPTPQLADATLIVVLLMLFVGISIIEPGLFKQKILIIAIGLIVIAVGYIFADDIGSFLLGV